MTKLLKGGKVVNVFTGTVEKENILIEDGKIIGVGDYCEADVIDDVSGKYICPGFIDGHIHVESTMMTPVEFAKAALLHGTTAAVADPHEITNVCAAAGIKYMLEASKNLPVSIYFMLPSCVPGTIFDESGAVLNAEDLKPFYKEPRVLGLAEVMSYSQVISNDSKIMEKIADAKKLGKIIDGHAPLLSGHDLDKYIAAGISSDHECSSFEEAKERIKKGQWVMIRQGTAAKNLEGLIDLFDEPWKERCLLVTDDRHAADFINEGHIDSIIRRAAELGKSPVTGIQMATINAAEYFGLKETGAVAPGYRADLAVLNSLEEIDVCDVYIKGEKIVSNKIINNIKTPDIDTALFKTVTNSFHLSKLKPEDFYISPKGKKCRVIKTIKKQLFTDEWITDIDFDKNNGIDTERDILKIAVIERHLGTGHKTLGFISGIGLKKGAIASSVSHDSHNIVVIGTNDIDMACAVNQIIEMGGGYTVSESGNIKADLALPIAGLMADRPAEEIAKINLFLLKAVHDLGALEDIEPLMSMSFLSLAVIPSLKITTKGLIDVNSQTVVPLFVD